MDPVTEALVRYGWQAGHLAALTPLTTFFTTRIGNGWGSRGGRRRGGALRPPTDLRGRPGTTMRFDVHEGRRRCLAPPHRSARAVGTRHASFVLLFILEMWSNGRS